MVVRTATTVPRTCRVCGTVVADQTTYMVKFHCFLDADVLQFRHVLCTVQYPSIEHVQYIQCIVSRMLCISLIMYHAEPTFMYCSMYVHVCIHIMHDIYIHVCSMCIHVHMYMKCMYMYVLICMHICT
jgi:hypothetical protein